MRAPSRESVFPCGNDMLKKRGKKLLWVSCFARRRSRSHFRPFACAMEANLTERTTPVWSGFSEDRRRMEVCSESKRPYTGDGNLPPLDPQVLLGMQKLM